MSIQKKIKNTAHFVRMFTSKYGIRAPFAIKDYKYLYKEKGCTLALYLDLDLYRMPEQEKENIYFNAEYYNLIYKINPTANRDCIALKTNYITRMPDLLGRSCLNLKTASLEEFTGFIREHPSFFAKRSHMSFGYGLHIYRNTDPEQAGKIYRECQDNRSYMIEEFIKQHPEMDRLFPTVVSTIRLCTLRTKEGIQLVFEPEITVATAGETDSIHSRKPVYKIWIHQESGRLYDKGFYIDNSTGKMTYGDTFHKDSGVIFSDFTIPYWQECQLLVKTAAERFPELAYIGWDVGISVNGPLIIEGNEVSGHIAATQRMRYLYYQGKNAGFKKETIAILEKGVYEKNETNPC